MWCRVWSQNCNYSSTAVRSHTIPWNSSTTLTQAGDGTRVSHSQWLSKKYGVGSHDHQLSSTYQMTKDDLVSTSHASSSPTASRWQNLFLLTRRGPENKGTLLLLLMPTVAHHVTHVHTNKFMYITFHMSYHHQSLTLRWCLRSGVGSDLISLNLM